MAQLSDLTAEQLTTYSATELIEALGGVADITIRQDGLYTKEWAEKVAKMDKVPIMIPTPDSWSAPFPFKQHFCVNDMKFEVEGDKLTMVPTVVFEVWRNKVDGDRLLRAHHAAASRRMTYSHIDQVPHY